ncbi:sensor histidine kinase [Paraflavitalea speifideaquila]|uniref:sensor histidine kinase n=1 Tax=Paraflavitalea speifideaquila TaxID=3076558 RepID=UPI0028EF16F9|nr:histidine kinase [Paraflavitalea speifideiaquila]
MPVNNIIDVFLTATLFVISVTACIILLLKYFKAPPKAQSLPVASAASNNELENQLLKTQLELQEQTLQQISQEIHDNIGQALTFVKLNINTIDLCKLEETQNKLTESKELISKAIQDLRNVAKSLNTDFINEAGLAACIEYQLHFLEKTGLYTTRFYMSESWCKSEPETELVLFRVVQELLNNIVKHAEAVAIDVKLECEAGKQLITVSDNGKGFMPAAQVLNHGEKGLGLGNMKNELLLYKVISSLTVHRVKALLY